MTGGNEQQEQQQRQTGAQQGGGMMGGAAAAAHGLAGKEAADRDGWGVLVPYTPQEQLAILQVRAAARSVGCVQCFYPQQQCMHAAVGCTHMGCMHLCIGMLC
jgi:hypothetical protein